MTTKKERALAQIDKMQAQAERLGMQLAGFIVGDIIDAARSSLALARSRVEALPDDFKPTRKRGAHVIAGKIYAVKPNAQKHYQLGGDASMCLVEFIREDGMAIGVFADDAGNEIKASVKVAHLGKEVK